MSYKKVNKKGKPLFSFANVIVCVALVFCVSTAWAEKRNEGYDAVFKNFYTRVEYVDDLTAVEAAADKFTIYLPNDDSQEAFDRTYGAFHTGNGGAFSASL